MDAPRVILDTNVLISAFGWVGNPRRIFGLVLENKLELLVSEKQIDELKRVLDYPKLGFTEDQKRRFLDVLCGVASVVETHNYLDVIKEDPQDNLFLEAAIEHKAMYIVSGDRHLLRLGEFNGVKILTPAKFLELPGDNLERGVRYPRQDNPSDPRIKGKFPKWFVET